MKKIAIILTIILTIVACPTLIASSQPAAAAGAGAADLLHQRTPDNRLESEAAFWVLMNVRQAKTADQKNIALEHARLALHYHQTQVAGARKEILMEEVYTEARKNIEKACEITDALQKYCAAIKNSSPANEEFYQAQKALYEALEKGTEPLAKAPPLMQNSLADMQKGFDLMRERLAVTQRQNEHTQKCAAGIKACLERFDAIFKELAEGLPKALLQKQYHEKEALEILNGLKEIELENQKKAEAAKAPEEA